MCFTLSQVHREMTETQTYANLFYKIFAGGQGALHEKEENIHLFIKG